MATITRRSALALAVAAYEATPEANPEVIAVLDKLGASLKSRKSDAPSKEHVKNGLLIENVVLPFAAKCGHPFTAKELAEKAGSPEVTTSQKASGLITRAIAEGQLVVAPYVRSRTYINKQGREVTSLVKPCYQVPSFDFEPFAPKAKEEATEAEAE